MHPRPPDFIGIGAQKAGTCWLRANLARHPRVWMPSIAELHYFDRPLEGGAFPPAAAAERFADAGRLQAAIAAVNGQVKAGDLFGAAQRALYEFLDHDDDWYRAIFAAAPAASVTGEITPRYAICGDAEIAHMHAVAPAAKIVFLLRHPVSRFWSQCKMKYGDSSLAPGDPAAMRLLDSPNGRPRGEYTQTMLRFARRYDPGRMLLVFHDAIAQQPVQVLQRIFSFLGVEDQPPDEALAVRRVNHAADDRTIPESLRGRVEAAYRSEMETLAEVFGGYAAGWLDGTRPDDAAAVVPLSAAHIDAIERRPARVRSSRTKPPCRVFCISMQRSGTTSVGDWLESHGLVRAGSPTSVRLGWTRLWMRGEHEAIFSSAEFQKAEVLEDDPWWCPDYYRFLAMRFPDARFILLTRDPDEWFTSLCHHSGGQNPGWSDVHARIYDREADLRALVAGRTDIDPTQQGLLSIVDHGPHYKAAYQRHAEAARTFFAGMPGRLFTGRLEDPQTFIDLCEFAGVMHNPAIAVPRSNARTEEMSRRLAAHRARMNR